MHRRKEGGTSCCLWGVMSGNIRLLAFARRLELALPWCSPWRKTANEDEHGWVCSSSSAPACHVFTLAAQGWQRARCGEELPTSNPEQGLTCKGLCAVLGGRKRLRHSRGQERAADRALHPQRAQTNGNTMQLGGRVESGSISCGPHPPGHPQT